MLLNLTAATPLVQPAATLLAGVLVFSGVVLTLRYNKRRRRQDEATQTIRDRDQRLRSYYSDFAAAAFDRLQTATQVVHQSALIEDPANFVTLDNQVFTKVVADEYHRRLSKVWDDARAFRCRLSEAFGRIMLTEGDDGRRDKLFMLYSELCESNMDLLVASSAAIHISLDAFLHTCRKDLDIELRDDLLIAEDGQWPPIEGSLIDTPDFAERARRLHERLAPNKTPASKWHSAQKVA